MAELLNSYYDKVLQKPHWCRKIFIPEDFETAERN
jgi:hypothetical protein